MSNIKNSTFSQREAPPRQITLFGIREDELLSQAFSVKVDPSATVYDLKKLVKAAKQPQFDDIPADELRLFSVSIPYNRMAANDPFHFFTRHYSKQPLHPMETMSDVFEQFGGSVSRDRIHFMVENQIWSE